MINNYDNIINEAGNTIFTNIYKNCQTEIKDLIITKLLIKIQQINLKNELLEKENKKLKDNFIYILKRLLSNKEELNNTFYRKFNKYKNKYNSISNTMKESYNLQTIKIEKNKPNYSLIESCKTLRYKTELNNDSLTNSNIFEPDNIKEEKAKKYLNKLLRNNFYSYSNGTPNAYFINKNKSIYDELFPKTSKTNNLYLSTFSNIQSPKTFIKVHRRYKSTSCNDSTYTEEKIFEKQEKNNYNNIFNKIKKLKIKKKKRNTNNKKKFGSLDIKNNKQNNNKIQYIRNINNLYSLETEINKSNKINKYKFPYLNRSPYLINKF